VTPEQSKLAAEHVDFTLGFVRRGKWRTWSEAESTALELLCRGAVSFDPEQGQFKGYLASNLNRWLATEFRVWTHYRRVRHPTIKAGFVPLSLADAGRIPDDHRSAEDSCVAAETARRELRELPKRTVAILRYMNCGYEKQEVAAALRVSPSAVSKALQNGRERIIRYREVA
jgi:DNA-directed RNA polymerase specialized sigma24 family protein